MIVRSPRRIWSRFGPTEPDRRPLRLLLRGATVLVVVLAAELLGAAPAGADGAGPTNFESRIDSVEPPSDRVRVDVVGGDSFLSVRATPGSEVDITGYDGEPYLRIDADGVVWRNERSAATYLNLSRDGTGVDLPDDVDSRGEPRWARIGDGGEVAWHDHRIHWMLDDAPGVGDDRLVQRWTVPLVVDGAEHEVAGRLLLHPDEPGWTVALGALGVLVALGLSLGSRRLSSSDRKRATTGVLVGASMLALAVAVGAHAVNPSDAGASLVPVALPVVALVAAAAAGVVAVLARRGSLPARPPMLELALPLGAVAALTGWVVTRIAVVWVPLVPTVLPAWLDRIGTTIVAGVAVGVTVALLRDPTT